MNYLKYFVLSVVFSLLLTVNTLALTITHHGEIDDDFSVDYFNFTLDTDTFITYIYTSDSTFDPVLYFAVDDGNLTSDDIIAYNDDFGVGVEAGLVNLNLSAGDYLVGISEYSFSESEFLSGFNYNVYENGEYILNIVACGQDTPAPVPEPATILLFGIGLTGISFLGAKMRK